MMDDLYEWIIEGLVILYDDDGKDQRTSEWWSNTIGWVGDLSSATKFTSLERKTLYLPLGNDVHWVYIGEVE